MNIVILTGRLGHDIDKIDKGYKFRLAVQDYGDNPNMWFQILYFTEQDMTMLTKGSKVLIEGRLITSEYEGKEQVKIIASRIEFIQLKSYNKVEG